MLHDRPDIRFVMAGSWVDNSDREEADKFIRANHLSKVIDFIGPVEGISNGCFRKC